MEAFKLLLCFGIFTISFHLCSSGATDIVLEVGRLMRDICQPKFKVPNELADGINKGKFPEDGDVKCYVNCVMELMQVIKKGKFLHKAALKQTELMLPDDMKEDYRNGIAVCKDTVTRSKDHCESAYTLLKCLHGNIATFLFP